MKVLITGAQGQVGRALAQAFPSHTVSAFSRQELDITQLKQIEEILDWTKPDIVLNAAAFTLVDEAELRSVQAYEVNENGPLALAILTADREIPLVHFSTDYVFDGTATKPYTEDAQTNPLSTYAKSKLAGEIAVQKTNPQHYIVRTAWVYHTEGKNFPNNILALAGQPQLRVVNDQYGSPTYAPHLARAVAKMIERKVEPGVYHLAGTGEASWYDLARALFARMNIKTPIVPVPGVEFKRAARRPVYGVLANTKAPELALPPWEQGVDDFVKDKKNN